MQKFILILIQTSRQAIKEDTVNDAVMAVPFPRCPTSVRFPKEEHTR